MTLDSVRAFELPMAQPWQFDLEADGGSRIHKGGSPYERFLWFVSLSFDKEMNTIIFSKKTMFALLSLLS